MPKLIRKDSDKEQFRRWQALYIIKTHGASSEEAAETVRVSSGTVLQRVHLYNNNGEEALILKGRGGRRRCHMSHDEEISFLKESEKEACQGHVITAMFYMNQDRIKILMKYLSGFI